MKNFDLGILFVRLGLGICLFMHGFAKILHGVGGVKGILAKAGLPEIMAYSSYTGEVVAPIMIILGYFQALAASRLKFYIFTSPCRLASSLAEAENTLLKKISAIKFALKDGIYLILSQI